MYLCYCIISANQETIVELMNFFNTLLPSGQTQSSTTNPGTITENEVAEDELKQVRLVSAFCCVNHSVRNARDVPLLVYSKRNIIDQIWVCSHS